MAEYTFIDAQVIDNDLLSGSGDSLRTALGGYYTVVDIEATDESEAGSALEFVDILGGFSDYEMKGYLDIDSVQTIDENTLTANRKIPMRVYTDSELVTNDVFWKTLWVGGEFGDVTYFPIYNDIVHSYYNASYELPYPQIEANALTGDDISSTINISYDYGAYLSEYQDYATKLDSELLMPSYYLMFDMANTDNDEDGLIDESLYSADLVNYMTAERNYDDVLTFFDFNWAKVPGGVNVADYEDEYGVPQVDTAVAGGAFSENFVTRNSYMATEFLTASYVHHPLSSSTQAWVKDHLQNLLFDEQAMDLIMGGDSGDTTFGVDAAMLPYSIKIRFNEYPGNIGDYAQADSSFTVFADSIKANNFSSKFMKTLYKAFDNKLDDLKPNEVEYITNLQYSSASIGDEIESTIETANNTPYREVDYVSFLAHCYNNYLSSDEGCLFVGPNTIERLSATDTTGVYRHINARTSLNTLTETVDYLANESNISINDEKSLFSDMQDYIEPVAYRVEKIGGPPSGDSFTQNTLQNFWFFKPPLRSSESSGEFTFYDSQVKYDTDYTYKVYAYAIMVGFRYKYSDLALTRDIGCEGEKGEYGLEFYDPLSSDEGRTPRLYSGSAGDNILIRDYDTTTTSTELILKEVFFSYDDAYYAAYGSGDAYEDAEVGHVAWVNYYGSGDFDEDDDYYSVNIDETETDSANYWTAELSRTTVTAGSRGSALGSESQIFSDFPYAADFYLNYEPTAKIVEIPLYEKTLKVLDNPANRLSVAPYQVVGNSQKIGFDFAYTSFVDGTFPSIISDEDEAYKEAYVHANDLFEDSYLDHPSIALQRYVEVYRLSSRPTAITDFNGSKIAEIDLAVENLSQYSYKGAFYDDTIKTNQKYYYLFRVLNQQRNLSHLTEITEAELINDGGYKYVIFNILYEYELEQEVFNEASTKFKKLIQLQPNLAQLEFNTDDLDYAQSAASQIDNLIIGSAADLIWDKTFKVRLSSKKTSRKIDLNITYKLNSD